MAGRLKGYKYCKKHDSYYFIWKFENVISRCSKCRQEVQDKYDEKHSVIIENDKRQCTRCKKFKNTFNFSTNKFDIKLEHCDVCARKIRKQETEIKLTKLIRQIDGQHHSGTKNRTV